MLIEVVLLIGGLVLLYYGAEWLVTGSSKLAFELGISPLIIGLTVVAFGTSAPELVVTGAASLQDSSDVSLGNIVGSNICNIALVLGAAAVIRPVHVDQATVRRDYPVMLGASAALYGMAWLGEVVDRVDGALLLTAMMGFTFYTVRLARRAMRAHKEATEAVGDVEVDDLEDGPSGTAANVGLVAIGVIGLVIGAELMVSSAIAIATALSVPEFVIAVSVVAFGTSLPELATSVVAAIRDESDISVGNRTSSTSSGSSASSASCFSCRSIRARSASTSRSCWESRCCCIRSCARDSMSDVAREGCFWRSTSGMSPVCSSYVDAWRSPVHAVR